MNLIDKIYSSKTLYNKLKSFVFFYGINSSIPFIERYFKKLKYKYDKNTIKTSIEYVYKIEYLTYVMELVRKLRYFPKLNEELLNPLQSNYVKKVTETLSTDWIVTKYVIEDMQKYKETGTV